LSSAHYRNGGLKQHQGATERSNDKMAGQDYAAEDAEGTPVQHQAALSGNGLTSAIDITSGAPGSRRNSTKRSSLK